jgi:hypothetical protein
VKARQTIKIRRGLPRALLSIAIELMWTIL